MSQNIRMTYTLGDTNTDTKGLGEAFLLDTTILIEALKTDNVMRFLNSLVKDGCELFTIPDVLIEFIRRASNRIQHKKYKDIFRKLRIEVLSPRDDYYESDEFMYMYHHDAEKGSCTDYRLCLELYNNPELKLISGNHRDIPLSMFNRDEILVVDKGQEIHTEAVYKYDKSKFLKRQRQLT